MIWKSFFRDFAGRSQTPVFYNEKSASSRPSFRNFGSQSVKTTSGPRTAQRRLREVPGEPGEGLEELCESSGGALYIEKLPINRPSGRYVLHGLKLLPGEGPQSACVRPHAIPQYSTLFHNIPRYSTLFQGIPCYSTIPRYSKKSYYLKSGSGPANPVEQI